MKREWGGHKIRQVCFILLHSQCVNVFSLMKLNFSELLSLPIPLSYERDDLNTK